MTTVWTQEADARLRDYLASHELVAGIGTEELACSVAAINLALTEKVTDAIPKCMSKVIGQWMIVVQDAMPSEMRNSPGWKRLLPMAAGTGREREEERLALVMDWMWGTVLPDLQSVADQGGFGAEWRTMCVEKSPEAAKATAEAAIDATRAAAGTAAGDAAWDARDAARAAPGAARAAAWERYDPVGLLARLVAESEEVVTRGTSYENRANLAPAFYRQVIRRYEGTRRGQHHGRSFVGIELNPDYVELARRRITNDAPLLNVPAEALQ